MSAENIEIVRAICDAYARGDYEGALDLLDEEIEFVSPPDISGGGQVWRGREGTRQGVTSFLGTWDEYHYEVHNRLRRRGPGRRLAARAGERERGRGIRIDLHRVDGSRRTSDPAADVPG
jgi:SnoaL-like protein